MDKKAIRQNLLPIISLVIIVLIGFLFAFKAASASVSFHEADENWDNYENDIDGSKIDTYPYNSSTASISMVSMDVLYGTTRSLVWYHGEFPYAQIYDKDDEEYKDGWEGYYAEDGTDADGTNPGYGASCGDVDAADYWGTGVSGDNFENVPTAEQINEGDIKSLRLYASTMTTTGIAQFFSGALYSICNFFAWVAVLIIGLIIRAKNISMEMIMEILNLDSLNDTMTKNFIWDGDHLKLSAFTGFCLIILIFTIAAFAIKWVKGGTKTQGVWEIIGTMAIGAIIIGICLAGRLTSLGSTVATLTNKVLYTVAESLAVGGDGHAFEISIDDAEHETEITQMCEMALVNKAYIDLQLCSQFDVNSIDDLKFDEFGDSGGSTAATYLAGVDSADMTDDFNNNLGYYYWFANSSAKQKTSLNATYPETDAQSVHNKLSSIMTYLQVQHNANAGDAAIRERIENTTRSFAWPGGGPRFLSLLVFAVVLILLALVLFKYALNVVIAKLELFIALLGMTIAGPLILTSNQKLVKTGKFILGMLVVAFMEITIYSVIFDIIVYTICAMFKPDIIVLLAILVLLILLLYFNPMIAQKIKQVMEGVERNIAPELVNGRRAAKNWMKTKAREGIQKYENGPGKVIGYDENGDPIREEGRKGDALSRLMNSGANAIFAEGNEHKGLISQHKKFNEESLQRQHSGAVKLRQNAEKEVEAKRTEIYREAEKEQIGINTEVDNTLKEAKVGTNEYGEDTYDETKLTEEERRMVADRTAHRDELEELENNGDYLDLKQKQAELDKINARLKEGEEKQSLSTEDAARLSAYNQKLKNKRQQIAAEKEKINEAIKERAAKEAMAKRGLDYDSAEGGNLRDKIDNATKKAAIDKHKDEMENVLKTAIATMSDEVNDTSKQGKIGRKSTQTLNKDAAQAQAAAMLQLSQLQNGEDIMKADGEGGAKQAVKDIVDRVSQHYDKDMHSTDAHVRAHLEEQMQNAKTQEDYDAAKVAFDKEMKRQAETHGQQMAEVKGQYATAKSDNGKVFVGASVQEQLQSAINHRNDGKGTPAADPNEAPNMSSVVTAAEAAAPKTTTHAAQPQPQAQAQSQPQTQNQNQSQPQAQAQAKPQPQAQPQQAPNMYNNPAQAQPQAKGKGNQPNALNNLDMSSIPGGGTPAQPQAKQPQQSQQNAQPQPRQQQNAQPQPRPQQNAQPQQRPQQQAAPNMYTNPASARPQQNAQPYQQAQQPQQQAAPARQQQNVPQQNARPNMYTNPAQARPQQNARPNPYAAPQQMQADMGSVINQREAVSAAEARQGDARAQQQQMANVIEQQTQSISHGKEATKADYVADEQRMDAMNQDRRIIKNIYGESTGTGGRQ